MCTHPLCSSSKLCNFLPICVLGAAYPSGVHTRLPSYVLGLFFSLFAWILIARCIFNNSQVFWSYPKVPFFIVHVLCTPESLCVHVCKCWCMLSTVPIDLTACRAPSYLYLCIVTQLIIHVAMPLPKHVFTLAHATQHTSPCHDYELLTNPSSPNGTNVFFGRILEWTKNWPLINNMKVTSVSVQLTWTVECPS